MPYSMKAYFGGDVVFCAGGRSGYFCLRPRGRSGNIMLIVREGHIISHVSFQTSTPPTPSLLVIYDQSLNLDQGGNFKVEI